MFEGMVARCACEEKNLAHMCDMSSGTNRLTASNSPPPPYDAGIRATYRDDGATLDDLCEAVMTLEDAERIARRVFGGANPVTANIEQLLRLAQEALRARETPSGEV
jgi:hypothetical protein